MRTCSIEGCAAVHLARGFCKKHYQRWQKTGDALCVRKQLQETHSQWKERPGYQAAHLRVRRVRGLPSDFVCRCGEPAREWAYDHQDPDELRSPEGKPYSLDLNHYDPMCVPCHRRLDAN